MKKLFIIIGWAFISKSLFAQHIYSCTNGHVQFHSDAPLEIIQASSEKLTGAFDADKRTFSFNLKISSFEGFNSPRQREHFNENYLESEKYQQATFKGKIIEDFKLHEDSIYEVRAKGVLTIHGIDAERIIKLKMSTKNNTIKVLSDFTILLKDYNIRIPKVVHEKITSEVLVKIKVELLPIKTNK